MGDVTFLGLGLMGTALAETAINAGYATVVWNRSESPVKKLVAKGARYHAQPADAIAQSPIVIVCVNDYSASNEILKSEDALKKLSGRVLVQLTSGSPRQAQSSHRFFNDAGVTYLDGAIMSWPSQIGEQACRFLISGDKKGFTSAEPLLRVLAPQLEYLGENPGAASALDSAMLSGSLGVLLGVINGAALCEATGVPVEKYAQYLPEMTDDIDSARDSLQKIVENRLEETQAPLEVWAATTSHMIESAEDAGFSAEIPLFIKHLCNRAIDQGYGRHSIGAIINVLRPNGR